MNKLNSKVHHRNNSYSRRDFLKKTGAMSALFIGSGMLTGKGCTQVRREGQAKNVIFLVSDGMSIGTLTMTDVFLRRRDGRASNWAKLYEEGNARQALMDMASANRIVTDSAAAASSWGCGYRINNGGVNYGVNGELHKPILPIFREAGKSTGLVTTTRITHATPAGFAANVEARGMEDEIAAQYLDRKVDLLLGGGSRHYAPDQREDGRNLYVEHEEAGYHVVRNRNELMAELPHNPLLGIFSDGHHPYTIDQINTPEYKNSIPTLAEMTDVALRKLSEDRNGFILQVEGGRVDHAAHGNCLSGLIYDQIAFDEAIGSVMEFTENRDDTLVIITTDHGNANPGLNSAPNEDFDRIQNFRHSHSWIHSELDENSTISQIRERINFATGLEISRDEADAYLQATKGTYTPVYQAMSGRSSVLGQIVANHTNVNWIGGSHTSDYVELASYGPGSEALEGLVMNTDLFGVMTKAAGVLEFAEA